MFDVPEAKRVRREELYDSASEEEIVQDGQEDSGLRARLNAQLSGLLNIDFGLDEAPSASGAQSQPVDEEPSAQQDQAQEDEEMEFEFRLFNDEGPTQRVVLQKDQVHEPGSGAGGFVVARRPISYYVATDPDAKTLQRYRFAAVTAEHILRDAKRRRWGLEKPWKVTHISISDCSESSRFQAQSSADDGNSQQEASRKRPGKKRRIIIRMREKAKKEKEDASKQQLLEKEEHVKEKKKRLNRLKKLKRREKGREQKAAGKTDSAAPPSSRESSPE